MAPGAAVDAVLELRGRCGEDEARIAASVRRCRQLLRGRETRLVEAASASEEPGPAEDLPPEELQDLHLLDRLLEKAMRVRSGVTRLGVAGPPSRERTRAATLQPPAAPCPPSSLIGGPSSVVRKSSSSAGAATRLGVAGPPSREQVAKMNRTRAMTLQPPAAPSHPSSLSNGPSSVRRTLSSSAGAATRPGVAGPTSRERVAKMNQTRAVTLQPPAAPCPPSSLSSGPSSVRKSSSSAGAATRPGVASPPSRERVAKTSQSQATTLQPPAAPSCPFSLSDGPSSVRRTSSSSVPLCSAPPSPAWAAPIARQDRLWDEVVSRQHQSVPERRRFVKKLQVLLPAPPLVPADARCEAVRLARLGGALRRCYHAELSMMGVRPGLWF
ncbi:nascent polypeptide-associated complex subunit alpha, muscle-specific form-like [Denticeps clupeoides]|uniref:nascent polypeptide-associated complex subunit alpha, muscle-specific form-like n=1 Tax=Denticeps clupeoides TaxID=299321 RepID=UPI0010A34B64|nr:nascent polypeptide-associated complex subunit alpha, muscle-specific form-like [Denticeps clupeoides]